MPLTMLEAGRESIIKRISGKSNIRRFLANLGFTEGGKVKVVMSVHGNIIAEIKGSRIAVSSEIARRILV